MASLGIGMPLWDTAVPTGDGIPHRRTFDYTPLEGGILGPLGGVVRGYLDQHPEHPMYGLLSSFRVGDLASQTQIIMTIDDQTWKDHGFWPTSDWHPVV